MDYTCTFLVYHLGTLRKHVFSIPCQDNSRIYVELDAKVQTKENTKEEKEN